MSLASKFKTDATKVVDGVWFEFDPNKDGTVPRFRLARTSKQNKKYKKALRNYSKRFIDEDGKAIESNEENDTEAEQALLMIFCDAVLLEWENVQLNDDGVNFPFSQENAVKLLGSVEWGDLYDDLTKKAADASKFRAKLVAAETKN